MVDYDRERAELVKSIERRGIRDKRVIDALLKVPRHLFVPEYIRDSAYDDRPLPIGYGQTISQPYIVALMTEALELPEEAKVLEIGTGSGYQAAILAEIAKEVYTVERIPELLERARKLLVDKLGYKNIKFKLGDGTEGWQEHAPYDAIIVTAAAPKVPEPLVEQLKEGGVLVIPVGSELTQELLRIRKLPGGKIRKENLGGCVFVKLKGRYGWPE